MAGSFGSAETGRRALQFGFLWAVPGSRLYIPRAHEPCPRAMRGGAAAQVGTNLDLTLASGEKLGKDGQSVPVHSGGRRASGSGPAFGVTGRAGGESNA